MQMAKLLSLPTTWCIYWYVNVISLLCQVKYLTMPTHGCVPRSRFTSVYCYTVPTSKRKSSSLQTAFADTQDPLLQVFAPFSQLPYISRRLMPISIATRVTAPWWGGSNPDLAGRCDNPGGKFDHNCSGQDNMHSFVFLMCHLTLCQGSPFFPCWPL